MTSGVALRWNQLGLDQLLALGIGAGAEARPIPTLALPCGASVTEAASAEPWFRNRGPRRGSLIGGGGVARIERRPCHSSGSAVRKDVGGWRLLNTER